MKVNRKYLKRFREDTKRTNKNAVKILAIEDQSFNRRAAMGLNEDDHVKSAGKLLYLYMLKHHAIQSHSDFQEFTGLNKDQLKNFCNKYHLNDASLDESLKQINRLQ
ncbi:hypothetical protein [Acetilactobacillus jinshanensis]|uniref:Uncharacterized protein n=1 Tax=Acetilactobacillus jinshanensis TaxID=1720083 RepID=A0A4P6ZKK0_9LACO|nr:hypothetical protein [Acetilactobacillus jinshanensis]QBP18305.1 hypothetical protein ELX58_03955 [Acetilactobacillus jinshanensis]URL61170.1 hypothetical protein HGK75_04020 [uncultured bacterium]